MFTPGFIFASLISLVGFRPASNVLPPISDVLGPRRATREQPQPAHGVTRESASPRRAGSPSAASHLKLVVDAAASCDASGDASRDASEDDDPLMRKLNSYQRDASAREFIIWLRARDWLGPFSASGIYIQHLKYCEAFQRRPLTPRKLQNKLKSCGVIVTRPTATIVDGKEHRPTYYTIRQRRQRKAAA